MTIPASLETVKTGFEVLSASNPGAPRGSSEPAQSFVERWQALISMNKPVTSHAEAPTIKVDRSISTTKANESGSKRSHAGGEKSSQRTTPPAQQQMQIGTAETNSAGNLLAPIAIPQSLDPDKNQSATDSNLQQRTSGEAIPQVDPRRLQAENLAAESLPLPTSGGLQLATVSAMQQSQKSSVVALDKKESPDLADVEANEDGATAEAIGAPRGSNSDTQAVQTSTIGKESAQADTRLMPIQSDGVPSNAISPNESKGESRDAAEIESPIQVPKMPTPRTGSTPSGPVTSNQLTHDHANPTSPSHLELKSAEQPQAVFSRDFSAAHYVDNQTQNKTLTPHVLSSTGPSANVHETFAALDAGDSTATARWIHAGRNTAEAGFEDPALGWVGVRAQVGPGGLHATVVPGSADAAQTLSAHLSGLNAYLSQQRTPVETLTMATTNNQLGQQAMDQRGGHPSRQGTNQDGNSSSENHATIHLSQHPVASSKSNDRVFPASRLDQGGAHISVLA